MNRTATVRALRAILDRSPFFPLLLHRTRRFGIALGTDSVVVDLDWDAGKVEVTQVADVATAEAPLWLAATADGLDALAAGGGAVPDLMIRSERTVPTAAERLLLAVFAPAHAPPMTSGDREVVIYPALFGDATPRRLWRAPDGGPPVEVLMYPDAIDGLHALVTSGLSNPELGPPAFAYAEATLSGFGYELAMLTDEADGVHAGQFVAWVEYVCRTDAHLIRGNWLELDGGTVPGTSLGGFLIVPPTRFPGEFPLGEGGEVWWSLLLPATIEEIAEAKRTGVMGVAAKIFDAGHEDFSPLTRPSTV